MPSAKEDDSDLLELDFEYPGPKVHSKRKGLPLIGQLLGHGTNTGGASPAQPLAGGTSAAPEEPPAGKPRRRRWAPFIANDAKHSTSIDSVDRHLERPSISSTATSSQSDTRSGVSQIEDASAASTSGRGMPSGSDASPGSGFRGSGHRGGRGRDGARGRGRGKGKHRLAPALGLPLAVLKAGFGAVGAVLRFGTAATLCAFLPKASVAIVS